MVSLEIVRTLGSAANAVISQTLDSTKSVRHVALSRALVFNSTAEKLRVQAEQKKDIETLRNQ